MLVTEQIFGLSNTDMKRGSKCKYSLRRCSQYALRAIINHIYSA
jgi:putative component of membrane protein insertase Oxa1/YidC/SpoIIIJ protein YidD